MKKTLTLKDLVPVLEVLGIRTEGQHIYSVQIIADVAEPVLVTIERFIKCDTGELEKICENYQLIKKEEE